MEFMHFFLSCNTKIVKWDFFGIAIMEKQIAFQNTPNLNPAQRNSGFIVNAGNLGPTKPYVPSFMKPSPSQSLSP